MFRVGNPAGNLNSSSKILDRKSKITKIIMSTTIKSSRKQKCLHSAKRLLKRLRHQDCNKTIIFTSIKSFCVLRKGGNEYDFVMLMAVIASDGRAMLPIVAPANIEHDPGTYQKVLFKQVLPWIRRRYRPGTWVLQQDYSSRSQASQSTRYFLQKTGIRHWSIEDYPIMASRLNPLSTILKKVSKMLSAENISCDEALKVAVFNVWRRLSRSYLTEVCSNFLHNIEMLVESKGEVSAFNWDIESKMSEQNRHKNINSSANNKSELSEADLINKMEDKEAQEAFRKMCAITSKRKDEFDPADDPSCPMLMLGDASRSVHCGICADRQSNIQEALKHQAEHAKEKHKYNSLTCVLCGRLFPSQTVLELHTLHWKVIGPQKSCQRCFQEFYDVNEEREHWCSIPPPEVSQDPIYECPFRCKGAKDTKNNLFEHLRAYHGCDEEEIQIGEGAVIANISSDFRCTCPRCNAPLNTLNIVLETHLFFSCSARGPIVKEAIRSMKMLSKKSGIDAHTFVRLELEAFFAEPGQIENTQGLSLADKLGIWEADMTPEVSSKIDPFSVAEFMREINNDIETGRDKEDDSISLVPKQSSSSKPSQDVLRSLENELGYSVQGGDDLGVIKKAGFKIDESEML